MADRLKPSVILIDVTLPTIKGVEAFARIACQHTDIHIIGLSMDNDAHQKMLTVGAAAVMTKTDSPEKRLKTIQRVYR